MRHVVRACVVALIAIVLGMVVATCVHARPVTFANLCWGYTLSKRGNDVLVRCPNDPQSTPWLTIVGCGNPTVVRTATMVTISCSF